MSPQDDLEKNIRASWNRAVLRELLTAAFTDGELTALCYDFYPRVYDEFGEGMGKSAKVHRLLAHCISHEQVEALLGLVRERNPAQYERFEDGRLYAPAGGELAPPVQKEGLQDCEQRYRKRIKERYAEEAAYYIPLAGETTEPVPLEAGSRAPRSARRRRRRAAVEYREWTQTERGIKKVKLDTLREAVAKYPCVVLLGDPGSGKTTVLENLAYQFAGEPDVLPVLLRLSEYEPGMSLEAFIDQGWGGSLDAGHWGAPELAAHLEGYLQAGKLLLLFDALNEMPRESYETRIHALRRFIDRWVSIGNRFLVTCRVLDYRGELSGLQRVEVQPLSDDQIQGFLRNELPGDWQALWQRLAQGTDDRRLLEMARNPYLLTIMIDVFAEDGQLGRNRAELMDRFSHILLRWAKDKCPPGEWLDADVLREVLSVLAFETQWRAGFGTMIRTEQVKVVMPRQVQLDPGWPPVPSPPDRVLRLAASARIVEMPVDRSSMCFYHQLLQEYFAARELGRRANAGESLSRYWPSGWWEPSGWDETFILLAGMSGMEENASALLFRLAAVNPVVAGRCLLEGGAEADEATRDVVINALISAMNDEDLPPIARTQAGDILAGLGDPRPGVGLRPDGLPDIVWCEVPAGSFMMGSDDADEMAYGWEKPQHEVNLPAFRIARYPVTNAQYAAFARDGGYKAKWRSCWTDAGWEWKEDRSGPDIYGGAFDLPNHPAVGITWYEMVAFCHWLTVRMRETGEIGPEMEVTLPSEAQWEKAARGTDGRIYPWGSQADPSRANYDDTGIDATSAVGCFPGGASPYGALDMSGNVWEWCRTGWQASYENYQNADGLDGTAARVGRGGSFASVARNVRCAYRFDFHPVVSNRIVGFRIVVVFPG